MRMTKQAASSPGHSFPPSFTVVAPSCARVGRVRVCAVTWFLLKLHMMHQFRFDKENEDEEFIGQPMKEIWEEPVKVSILV